jgi:hypothetical protein
MVGSSPAFDIILENGGNGLETSRTAHPLLLSLIVTNHFGVAQYIEMSQYENSWNLIGWGTDPRSARQPPKSSSALARGVRQIHQSKIDGVRPEKDRLCFLVLDIPVLQGRTLCISTSESMVGNTKKT